MVKSEPNIENDFMKTHHNFLNTTEHYQAHGTTSSIKSSKAVFAQDGSHSSSNCKTDSTTNIHEQVYFNS